MLLQIHAGTIGCRLPCVLPILLLLTSLPIDASFEVQMGLPLGEAVISSIAPLKSERVVNFRP